eukprot:NODE_563_length_1362_cov_121.179757_g488_i1.p1 GENE.NODE_563_length_1362_cov_121.179757_g488_i1~~NODE_563_length_1362_cov_121.179757_g488_i1.p1  ORF type:complete len:384 (+),score=85.89 NODE_563_length_1362_cov_121.179757_g488_i1:91-1242(+)
MSSTPNKEEKEADLCGASIITRLNLALKMNMPQWVFALFACTAGIMGFFIIYGYLQEKLMTRPYGENGETFTDTAFLVLCNRLVAMFVAAVMIKKNGEAVGNVAPLSRYFLISISNFTATFCQYEALKYVTFPTQTLGKCGKMIPVLVLGSLFYGKQYTWKDYVIALCVMMGCTVFLLTGEISSKHGAESDSPFGLILMGGYLFADGFTSTFQEKLFKGYTMSTYNQMLYVNFSSACLSVLALLPNSRLFGSIAFATEFPEMLRDAVLLSFCATLGQIAIYYTIKHFGALTYSTIMTTRQFVSILLSCIIFLHPLTPGQWLGAVVVFAALYYKGFMKKDKKKQPEPKPDNIDPKDISDLTRKDDDEPAISPPPYDASKAEQRV